MKTREIREMSTEELKKRINDEYINLENLKFQHATTRIQNTAALTKSKHLIARMKTIVRQRELLENTAQEYTTETTKEE
jgi:large subunit ribosomal protein L29